LRDGGASAGAWSWARASSAAAASAVDGWLPSPSPSRRSSPLNDMRGTRDLANRAAAALDSDDVDDDRADRRCC